MRVGNLGTRTFDEICPAEICGYFTRKYRPVTCNLVNTLKLSVIIPAEVFIRLFYPFLRQRKPELTQFKLCLPGGCAYRIPQPWPDRWIRQQSRNVPPRSPSVIKADLLNLYCLCVRYNNVPRQISALLFENNSDYSQSFLSSPPSLSFTLVHVLAW